MNEKSIKRPNKVGKTNWSKVKSMTEQEIISAAKSDPDAQPLSAIELKKFKRVHPPTEVNIKKQDDRAA